MTGTNQRLALMQANLIHFQHLFRADDYHKTAMTLRSKDIDFIKGNLSNWLQELSLIAPVQNQQEQLQRLDAIEEALEQQRRFLKSQGEHLDRRISSVQQAVERQQESTEHRLNNLRDEVEQRLARLEKRIEATDKRSQAQDKLFQQLQEEIKEQGQSTKRRLNRSLWLIVVIMLLVGSLIGLEVFKLISTGSLI